MPTIDPEELFHSHEYPSHTGALPTDWAVRDVTDEEISANSPVYAGGYYC